MPERQPSIVLLCGESGAATDAIQQYAHALAHALTGLGADARVETASFHGGTAGTAQSIDDAVAPSDTVLMVQYNPFSFGRAGVALRFVRAMRRLRRRYPSLTLVVMCHETVVMNPGVRWAALRQVHRAQLRALLRLADAVYVSVDAWRPYLEAHGAKDAALLPVGSNLPDRRAQRDAARAALDATDRLIVATFSTGHPSHDDEIARRAVDAVVSVRPDTLVLSLGAGRQRLLEPGDDRERCPGHLPAHELAAHLAAADMLISPFVDGISTRRGTVMAALQHGVAVVGSVGRSTDPDLEALVRGLPGAGRGGDWIPGTAAALANDASLRDEQGRAGRSLYAARYDWPVLAARVLHDTGAAPAP